MSYTHPMLSEYLPILVFLVVGIIFGLFPIVAGKIIRPNKPSKHKQEAFECGFLPFTDSRTKFDVRYYLVAILFIIFDLEIAFLLPCAVILDKLALSGVIGAGIFLLLLTIGFIYEWRSGALEWE